MRTTIDRAGRIVVPKPIRDRLQLLGGGEVEVVERDGVIEITPVPVDMVFADTPEGSVVVSVEPLPALTDDVVFAAIDESRRWPR